MQTSQHPAQVRELLLLKEEELRRLHDDLREESSRAAADRVTVLSHVWLSLIVSRPVHASPWFLTTATFFTAVNLCRVPGGEYVCLHAPPHLCGSFIRRQPFVFTETAHREISSLLTPQDFHPPFSAPLPTQSKGARRLDVHTAPTLLGTPGSVTASLRRTLAQLESLPFLGS